MKTKLGRLLPNKYEISENLKTVKEEDDIIARIKVHVVTKKKVSLVTF